MKPKILLLNPPGKYLYSRDYFCSKISKADYINAPIDLVMLSGILNTGEFNLSLLDAIVEKLSPSDCMRKILEFNPDAAIVLLGSVSLAEDEIFLREMSQKFNGEIFVIGDIFLTEGRKFLENNSHIKGVILSFISDGIKYYFMKEEDKITDLILRIKDQIKDYPKGNFKEFKINLPLHEQFIKRKYRMPFIRNRPFATTIMSYGCPFKCSFCVMNTFEYFERDLDNIFKELDYLKALGVKEILFLDQTLGVRRSRYFEFLNKMIEKNYGFGWFGFTRVDLVDEQIIKLMKKAGCHTVWFGVESASGEILKKYRKGYNKEQIVWAFKLAKEAGIKTLASFLIGLPEETKKMIEDTISFSKQLDPDFASFSFAVPRFGTKLRESALDLNLIGADEKIMDQSGYKITMGTNVLSKEEMQRLKRKAIWGFYLRPRYIFKRILSLRTFTEFKMNLRNLYALIRNELKI